MGVLHFAKCNLNSQISAGAYLERCVAGIGEAPTANARSNWNLAKLESAISRDAERRDQRE